MDPLRRSAVVQLDVRGTPVADLWFASVLAHNQALPAVQAMLRFVQTRDAARAMLDQSSGVPVRALPPTDARDAVELGGVGARRGAR